MTRPKKSRKKQPPKPSDLSMEVGFPKGSRIESISISPSGVVGIDRHGNSVTPEYVVRDVHYDRTKGTKTQSRRKVAGGLMSIDAVSELTTYDSVFVTDTNTRIIGGERISAACFICLEFYPEGDKVRVVPAGHVNVYEFHNVPGNPEMLAILKVANDVLRSAGKGAKLQYVFFTDSELGAHDDINARREPIYGNEYLPAGFMLSYTSSDTGQEVLNKLIRQCDQQSSEYLRNLVHGSPMNKSPLQPLAEDPQVSYSYYVRELIEIVNPVVGGLRLQPGKSRVDVYGIKRREEE